MSCTHWPSLKPSADCVAILSKKETNSVSRDHVVTKQYQSPLMRLMLGRDCTSLLTRLPSSYLGRISHIAGVFTYIALCHLILTATLQIRYFSLFIDTPRFIEPADLPSASHLQ